MYAAQNLNHVTSVGFTVCTASVIICPETLNSRDKRLTKLRKENPWSCSIICSGVCFCLFTFVSAVQELLQLEDRLGSVSRGAVQTTIERFTFPHKYKKVGAK